MKAGLRTPDRDTRESEDSLRTHGQGAYFNHFLQNLPDTQRHCYIHPHVSSCDFITRLSPEPLSSHKAVQCAAQVRIVTARAPCIRLSDCLNSFHSSSGGPPLTLCLGRESRQAMTQFLLAIVACHDLSTDIMQMQDLPRILQ